MDVNTMKLRLEQWMPIFEEQAKSGMGKNEWIKANGIRRWEFYKRHTPRQGISTAAPCSSTAMKAKRLTKRRQWSGSARKSMI